VDLLRSNKTRASGENVAFYVACARLDARDGGSEEQQRALVGCLRLHRVSPLYRAAVAARSPWLPRQDRERAEELAAAPPRVAQALLETEEFAPFKAPARPASRLTQGAIKWALPLAELRALHEEAVALDVGDAADKYSPWEAWGGLDWRLWLDAVHEEGGVQVGLFLVPRAPPGCKAVGGKAAADVVLACGGESMLLKPMVLDEVDGSLGRGWPNFFDLGARAAWDAGAWRDAGFVSDGDVVKMTATIGPLA
jgi:hypothetical protein